MQAFSEGLPGNGGALTVILSASTFAFLTILAWEYCGEKCFEYRFGDKWILFFGPSVRILINSSWFKLLCEYPRWL
ncbi:MAG: sodium:alanine symporter family protein [Nitrospina sp.]|nr:sodium:alanine symporter family protein [Nitrospina sp.]MBT3856034.1 sodium:alanine symporter family protein [Nitrospina sp.]MBT4103642.1 sodium:alanine symporter family protein [Nitrospina sp.]MBT4389822.1 sodium:alanine symporter family protein [Nitrospina sp.]MBT4898487.1 sodium:alanine symporter family protein [Nitrospina sp.]